MSYWKYYVVSLHDGKVTGTDDDNLVESLRGDEDSFVINTQTGCWLQTDNDVAIKETDSRCGKDEDEDSDENSEEGKED